MQTVDEQPETIHLYVVREKEPKPSFAPIILSVIALLLLVAVSVALPYQQPVARAVIRVPAVLLPVRTFSVTVAFIPTGIKVYPATIAHGVLTITNGSIIGQSIPAGFTIQGVMTDYAVYVPGGNANGYGWAQVQAHAVASGHGGNLSPYSINSVIGSSIYIRNLSAFSGGRDSYSVKFVTAQDKQEAQITARNLLATATHNGLHYPCKEDVKSGTNVHLVWVCQFVTYKIPSFMSVSSVSLQGKNLLLHVWFIPRPIRFWGK